MKDQRSNPGPAGRDPPAGNSPDGPRPKTEGEVRGLRDVSGSDPREAAEESQPTQVDPEEAKLSREEKAKKIPPPGLMGDSAGPSA